MTGHRPPTSRSNTPPAQGVSIRDTCSADSDMLGRCRADSGMVGWFEHRWEVPVEN